MSTRIIEQAKKIHAYMNLQGDSPLWKCRVTTKVGDMGIAQRIRELRLKRGLSDADLAGALGVTRSAVNQMETGKGTKQYVKLRELAEILGTTPNYILGFEKDQPAALDVMGAAVEALLVDRGWPMTEALSLVETATKAALAEPVLGVDQRLAARTLAVTQARQHRQQK